MALYQIDGLVQERHNSSALAMELCLSCANPVICSRPYAGTIQVPNIHGSDFCNSSVLYLDPHIHHLGLNHDCRNSDNTWSIYKTARLLSINYLLTWLMSVPQIWHLPLLMISCTGWTHTGLVIYKYVRELDLNNCWLTMNNVSRLLKKLPKKNSKFFFLNVCVFLILICGFLPFWSREK